jgi:enoyl-CoA hydratase/carnithine racemase
VININNITATSTFLLPRLLGSSRANSLLLTGATFSPTSHFVSGLYHEIIPQREDVLPVALAFANDIATNTSSISVAHTKGLLQHPGETNEQNHLLDSRTIKMLGMGEDAAEVARAMKERRGPKFSSPLSKNWHPWVSPLFIFSLCPLTSLVQWRPAEDSRPKAKL